VGAAASCSAGFDMRILPAIADSLPCLQSRALIEVKPQADISSRMSFAHPRHSDKIS
jgi:hypothetical protein